MKKLDSELEQYARVYARLGADEFRQHVKFMGGSISEDRSTFTIRGMSYPTPAVLGRVASEHDTVSAITDFVKTGIGKRRWPYGCFVLIAPFDKLQEGTRGLAHQQIVTLAREMANIMSVEFVYALRS